MSTLNPVFYTGSHITGAGTATIAGPTSTTSSLQMSGVLHAVIINTPGTLCTVSDASGATKFALTTTAVGTFTYDIIVQFPLTVVTTGSGTDLSISTLGTTTPFYA